MPVPRYVTAWLLQHSIVFVMARYMYSSMCSWVATLTTDMQCLQITWLQSSIWWQQKRSSANHVCVFVSNQWTEWIVCMIVWRVSLLRQFPHCAFQLLAWRYLQMLLRPGCDLETYGDAPSLASKANYCSQGCVPEAVGSPYYCKGFALLRSIWSRSEKHLGS